jgi:hypothetical protein
MAGLQAIASFCALHNYNAGNSPRADEKGTALLCLILVLPQQYIEIICNSSIFAFGTGLEGVVISPQGPKVQRRTHPQRRLSEEQSLAPRVSGFFVFR